MLEVGRALERAVQIACRVHEGQKDKAGEPYILHPLRLMLQMQTMEQRIVAVLHDVLEDSELTQKDLLSEGFSEAVIYALDCLTRRPNESYDSFIERVATNPLAVIVKIRDLKDNMNLSRLPAVGEEDLHRVQKYHRAMQRLCCSKYPST